MRNLYILALFFSLAACSASPPNYLLVNPETGQTVNCSEAGGARSGANVDRMSPDDCVQIHRSIGFRFSDEIPPRIFTIKSDPPGATIYIGESRETLKSILSVTPIRREQTERVYGWTQECYQARKAGYKDSSVQCYENVWGERNLFFTLEKVD